MCVFVLILDIILNYSPFLIKILEDPLLVARTLATLNLFLGRMSGILFAAMCLILSWCFRQKLLI